MNDAEALNLITRYGTSWYADVDHIDPSRVGGKRVPQVDLVAAMRENIEEAKFNRDGIRKRYEKAQREGLFDLAALETVRDKKIREQWLAAIEVQQGDRVRCVSELKHWREYMGWALGQQRALPTPDTRLPPEADAEPPF